MKQIKNGDIVIEIEAYNRFKNLIRGYRVNDKGEAVAFLGKFIVPTNFTEEETIKLYKKGTVK